MYPVDRLVPEGDRLVKTTTRNAVSLVTLLVPAIMALWFAQYLIETFFPDVTLIDFGAFYAMGLFSGLATGILLGRSKREGCGS
jgi:hypothetical protein